jgi:hypothetical protein
MLNLVMHLKELGPSVSTTGSTTACCLKQALHCTCLRCHHLPLLYVLQ